MVGSLVLMFYLNAALTGVLLAVVPIVSIVAVQYGKLCSRSTIITLCHGVSLHILLKCLKNTFDQFIAIIFLKYFLYYRNVRQKLKPAEIKKVDVCLNISIDLRNMKVAVCHNIPVDLKITKKNYHTHLTKMTELLQFAQILNPFISTRQ